MTTDEVLQVSEEILFYLPGASISRRFWDHVLDSVLLLQYSSTLEEPLTRSTQVVLDARGGTTPYYNTLYLYFVIHLYIVYKGNITV